MLPLSVIIPTYNRAHLISRALKSAIAECDERDEILVVDDASTDDTAKVLAGFPRVTYIRAEHGGAGRTRNLGIARSKHPLVAFLDSDDEWVPGALAPRRALLEARPDLVFCFTDFAGTFSDGSYRHGLALTWHEDHRPWDQILGPPISIGSIPSLASIPVHIGRMDCNEMKSNYIAANTILVRRQLAGDALRFAEDLPTYEDWECFGRLTLQGECAYLNMESAVQHYHAGPRLTDASRLKCADARIKMLPRVWGANSEFLGAHREDYEATLFAQRRIRVRSLLITGRRGEACQEMSQHPGGWPRSLRLMALVPGGITKASVSALRGLKALLLRRKP